MDGPVGPRIHPLCFGVGNALLSRAGQLSYGVLVGMGDSEASRPLPYIAGRSPPRLACPPCASLCAECPAEAGAHRGLLNLDAAKFVPDDSLLPGVSWTR